MILAKVIATSVIISLSFCTYANDDIAPYVVGGVDSKAIELPWQVYIEIRKNGTTYACGGTLVTDSWVVTAAHCLNKNNNRFTFSAVSPSQLTVYSGGIDRTSSGDMSPNLVTNLTVHPDYEPTPNTGDIALLKLAMPVASPAQAIKLMDKVLQVKADIEFSAGAENNLILSGWGRTSTDAQQSTNILQKTAVNGVSDYSCALNWGLDGLESNFVCANAYNRGSCNGDSGGPLVWQDKSRTSDDDFGYRLAGVVSFGHITQCANNAYPDVYTEMSNYYAWVIATINQTDFYQIPDSLFTQDIFAIEDYPQDEDKSGGGIAYSFLLFLSGLLFSRRNK